MEGVVAAAVVAVEILPCFVLVPTEKQNNQSELKGVFLVPKYKNYSVLSLVKVVFQRQYFLN